MGNKFSDFNSNYIKQDTNKKTDENINIEDMYKKYSKLDNQSLFDEFIKLSLERKQKGELTDEYFQTIKKTLCPYLNNEQKKYFDSLVDKIK